MLNIEIKQQFDGRILTLPTGYVGALVITRPANLPAIEGTDYSLTINDAIPTIRFDPDAPLDFDYPITVDFWLNDSPSSITALPGMAIALPADALNISVFLNPSAIPTYTLGTDYSVDYERGIVRTLPSSRIVSNEVVTSSIYIGCVELLDESEVVIWQTTTPIALNFDHVFNVSITDTTPLIDYKVDHRNGVITAIGSENLTENQTITVTFSRLRQNTYATPRDYIEAFVAPDVAARNWIAVFRAIETATAIVNFYLAKKNIAYPTLPLERTWLWLKSVTIRLARCELKECNSEILKAEYEAALRELDSLDASDAADFADAIDGELGDGVVALQQPRRFPSFDNWGNYGS